ncbi:Glutamate or tyrosine decarboxylase [Agromyces sp. CF514]|uniref:pyridoxal phosphate-dependent decarboxylase family protein n=1 Tax=Agromyces sp. CF514 TaxID=1881031 RepID=UPI0008E0219F|nr:pyridoxal-dependent decarboxylase [Agromyces sp. CF514]SFR88762.1 Glutamate or tyrosine decarboxylase [Agromyces sp. CF514]
MMPGSEFSEPLEAAARLAHGWLDGVPTRSIVARADVEQVKDALGRELAVEGVDPVEVVEALNAAVEPGLIAMQSPRFFGWVIGGTAPAALAADWLVGAWDQNAALREVTPGVNGAEELAGEWLCDLLGLPEGTVAGFTTGATTANLVALAAARHAVLDRVGWDDAVDGIQGAPRIRVFAGDEHHPSVDVALRWLGLGRPVDVATDDQGRILPEALEEALSAGDPEGGGAADAGPAIVCLQAGNIHSGASDPFEACVGIAHAAGAWAHVDGAFGLWAAASERLRHLVAGVEHADSWATDAHKTLNVPYDAGIVAVADPAPLVAAMTMHAAYLPAAETGIDAADRVLELSRRARGVPTYAALRTLGRAGVADLVDGLAAAATALDDGLRAIEGVEVLNEVVFTQVCAAFDGRDVGAIAQALDDDGVALAHPSSWRGRDVLRFSVSNRGTDAAATAATLEAVRRVLAR